MLNAVIVDLISNAFFAESLMPHGAITDSLASFIRVHVSSREVATRKLTYRRMYARQNAKKTDTEINLLQFTEKQKKMNFCTSIDYICKWNVWNFKSSTFESSKFQKFESLNVERERERELIL